MTQPNRPPVTTTTTARLARIKLVRFPGGQTLPGKVDQPSLLPDTTQHHRIQLPGSQTHVSQETDQYPQVSPTTTPLSEVTRATRKVALWQSPTARAAAGLLVGIVLFALVLYYVNPIEILRTLQKNLTTPQGVLFAFLASLSFILAFCFRALRWRLFLNPVRQISQVKIIQVFLVGVFLNFVLPIRIGELAKCLILKRTDRIDVRQSLPTITMDKIQDLLPALLIVALAPLLGEQFDAKLWTMLFFAVSVLLGAILFVALTAWKRTFALGLLHKLSSLLPGKIGTKVEGFATGFVESLLACTRQPRIFLVAILLTAVSVSLDGLYNMFGFWTIGYHITFGQAVLGYMLFNLFYILPNPPGQVGSNEFVGLLIFSGILHIPPQIVLAEIVLFHAWSALLMCLMGMSSLSALGVSLSHAMKLHEEEPHP